MRGMVKSIIWSSIEVLKLKSKGFIASTDYLSTLYTIPFTKSRGYSFFTGPSVTFFYKCIYIIYQLVCVSCVYILLLRNFKIYARMATHVNIEYGRVSREFKRQWQTGLSRFDFDTIFRFDC